MEERGCIDHRRKFTTSLPEMLGQLGGRYHLHTYNQAEEKLQHNQDVQ